MKDILFFFDDVITTAETRMHVSWSCTIRRLRVCIAHQEGNFLHLNKARLKANDLVKVGIIFMSNASRKVHVMHAFDGEEMRSQDASRLRDTSRIKRYTQMKERKSKELFLCQFLFSSYLSSQKVHGVCNGMPVLSCFVIVLTASSDNIIDVFNRFVEVPSCVSHSAAAMFARTVRQHCNVKITWLPRTTVSWLPPYSKSDDDVCGLKKNNR